ncbi:MAG: formate--tetrahydrofolate ligase [Proteobacteria bacterium]|jgi:formate--tetrahydrofolate ligase|nr:formate--tetrahydrofolate ligase [Pseudomonadota bacterium]
MSDISIAQDAKMEPIASVARSRLGIDAEHLELYGNYKAKISLSYLADLPERDNAKLILVTAVTPTPAGEGKTTTTVGLGDALNHIGKNTVICLREPSLGPVFGMKGGAAGGGYAQVVPMEDINLHFTGDFNAIALANNLLAAVIDNHMHHSNELGFDPRRITWRRVLDVNDRALREVVIGLGGTINSMPRQDRFDIVVASEVMAILCLATSITDLKKRLGNIVVGYTRKQEPITARDLKVHGAMAALLKQAISPNLVQTLENNPAIIHGGPFANIAHGCNSVIATQGAMKLADYVVTEAGFGADLGAEKFINIKCRKSGLRPDVAVVVATIRALKFQGGALKGELETENLNALEKGMDNLVRHVNNVRTHFGLSCIICINRFSSDTDKEIDLIKTKMAHHGASVSVATHWADGAAGAEDLAHKVVELIESSPSDVQFLYQDTDPLWSKIEKVAVNIYGASEITANTRIRNQIKQLQGDGYGEYPVCIAKTPYSFSTDPELRIAPSGHVVNIREVRLAAGAEFIVCICGDLLTMPGLPRVPAAESIDIDKDGRITGLF